MCSTDGVSSGHAVWAEQRRVRHTRSNPGGPTQSGMPTLACLGNPDPVGMKVYCPTGKETFDDETTKETPRGVP